MPSRWVRRFRADDSATWSNPRLSVAATRGTSLSAIVNVGSDGSTVPASLSWRNSASTASSDSTKTSFALDSWPTADRARPTAALDAVPAPRDHRHQKASQGDNPMSDRAITPRGINHLVLNVRDLEVSHKFWTETIGFRQVAELKDRPFKMRFYSGVDAEGGVTHHDLALAEAPPQNGAAESWSMQPRRVGLNHVAIAWPDRE